MRVEGNGIVVARFTRQIPPPVVRGGYARQRRHVQADFEHLCAYCLIPEHLACGEENFEIDHLRPQRYFKDHIDYYYNLYWSCHVCNKKKWEHWPAPELLKIGIHYVDFCVDLFDDHYRQEADGRLSPLSLAGKYTIDVLSLNRGHLVRLRHVYASQGIFFR